MEPLSLGRGTLIIVDEDSASTFSWASSLLRSGDDTDRILWYFLVRSRHDVIAQTPVFQQLKSVSHAKSTLARGMIGNADG
jgi:hypothetical protein